MCVGELTWRREKTSYSMLVISGLILAFEITLIGMHTFLGEDRSMYLFLPVFLFYLVLGFKNWNPSINTDTFGGISAAIYVMQFGIITAGNKIMSSYVHIIPSASQWLIWLLVVTIPTVVYLLLKDTRIVKILF